VNQGRVKEQPEEIVRKVVMRLHIEDPLSQRWMYNLERRAVAGCLQRRLECCHELSAAPGPHHAPA
jgi:hypothetical protein